MKKLLDACRDKKAVFLDLDNTLYAYAPCHEAGLRSAWRAYRRLERVSFAGFLKAYDAARRSVKTRTRNQAASHSRLLYFQAMLESRYGWTAFAGTLALEKAYWDAYIKRIRLRPWVFPFLRELRKQGKRVLIVTDLTARIQFEKLISLKLASLVDFIITSEEAGVEKPDREIFSLALKKAGCRPGEAVMIGDDPKKDRNAGVPFLLI